MNSLKKINSVEKKFLYIILFTSFFNDCLRYKENDITIFRIIVIFGILICFRLNTIYTLKVYIILSCIAVISFFQSILFCYGNNLGINFSFSRYLKYIYFYFCIFSVAIFVNTIYKLDPYKFRNDFFDFLKKISYLNMFILFMSYFEKIRDYLYLSNVNDYGAYLTAIFPFFLYSFFKKTKISIIPCCLIIFLLYINDCKLDLIGVLIEIGIMILLCFFNSKFQIKRFFAFFGIFLCIFLAFLIVNSDLRIHEYYLRDLLKEPILRIMSGNKYPSSSSSTLYRTNVIIIGIEWLKNTRMLGIGIGNSGVLFRALISDSEIIPNWIQKQEISLHNFWMEISLEFGVLGIIFLSSVFIKIWKIIKKRKWKELDMITITTGISMWIWMMAPSGILTSYYLIALFVALFFLTDTKCKIRECEKEKA